MTQREREEERGVAKWQPGGGGKEDLEVERRKKKVRAKEWGGGARENRKGAP